MYLWFFFQSEKELSSEPEVVGEVNNVEFDETEIAVTVEKVAAKELTNDDVKSVDVEVAIEEESTKEVKAGYALPLLKNETNSILLFNVTNCDS